MINDKICAKHQADLNAWRGIHDGEYGWGPGHRIPMFDLSGSRSSVAIMDEEIGLIRTFCLRDAGCSNDPQPPQRCPSPDHC